jgi:hypothetical protein
MADSRQIFLRTFKSVLNQNLKHDIYGKGRFQNEWLGLHNKYAAKSVALRSI